MTDTSDSTATNTLIMVVYPRKFKLRSRKMPRIHRLLIERPCHLSHGHGSRNCPYTRCVQVEHALPQFGVPLTRSSVVFPRAGVPLPQSSVVFPQSGVAFPQSGAPLARAGGAFPQSGAIFPRGIGALDWGKTACAVGPGAALHRAGAQVQRIARRFLRDFDLLFGFRKNALS